MPSIAAFCHVSGWYLAMYGAGWVERRNIAEYERAARLAIRCGAVGHVDELLSMAEVEWEHERYVRLKAASHRLSRLLPVWRAPAPRHEIRHSMQMLALPPSALPRSVAPREVAARLDAA
jgi:hypothetical protein